MDWVERLGTVILTLLAGGVGALILKVIQLKREARKENRVEDRKDKEQERKDKENVWTKQMSLIDRLEKQLAVVQAEQQRSLVAEMASRQECARLRALGQWLYDSLTQMHADLKRRGAEIGPLPHVPEFGQVAETTSLEREYVQRSVEHATGLLKEEVAEERKSSKLSRPPTGELPTVPPRGETET